MNNIVDLSITGFSSFGDVDKNPTEEFIEYFKANPREFTCLRSPIYKINNLESEVLEVSVDAVNSYFCRQKNREFCHVRIHLGVHCGIDIINLEKCAWNNMTFRIPDVKGYHPQNLPIVDTEEFDSPLVSKFSLEVIQTVILKQYQSSLFVSNDPGRYLCNYIYYKSLKTGSIKINDYSLFVHVPPQSKMPLSKLILALDRLIECVVLQALTIKC